MKFDFWKKDPDKQYDEAKRSLAKRKCAMIYLVVVYILYQAYSIVDTKLLDKTTMSWTEVFIAAGVLGIASIATAVFATLKMAGELRESEIEATEDLPMMTEESTIMTEE